MRPVILLMLSLMMAAPAAGEPSYGIAMHGDPALPVDFTHFP